LSHAPMFAEMLSEAERRFDLRRRSVGLFAGPAAFLLLLAWPMPELSLEAHRLAAIATLVVIWWVTEALPLPITAVLGTALAVLLGVATPAVAFAPFADPIIFLFIGSFMLSRALVVHGVDTRLVHGVLALPLVGRSFTAAFVALITLVVLLSAWMSNMVATAMMLPVMLGLLRTAPGSVSGSATVPRTMLLALAYSASIGGMVTPVGAAPNLITIGLLGSLAGTTVPFLTWVAIALPISVVMIVVLLAIAGRKLPAFHVSPVGQLEEQHVAAKWHAGQINASLAFLVTVALWVLPGVLSAIAPEAAVTELVVARVDPGVAAIVGAGLLFVLPIDWSRRQFTVSWGDAAKIEWGTILLLGGGFSLGRMMFDTGLAAHIAEGIIGASGSETLWTITAIATLLGIVLTELTSNTAATSMLVPVVISVCVAAGVDPVAPAIGACLGASLAFMLPISTPSNAIIYGTGLVPIGAMIRFGVLLDLVGFVVIQVGLWLLVPLLWHG
jgi:sodium-dependent dicarboxylate transporter 2/3/5